MVKQQIQPTGSNRYFNSPAPLKPPCFEIQFLLCTLDSFERVKSFPSLKGIHCLRKQLLHKEETSKEICPKQQICKEAQLLHRHLGKVSRELLERPPTAHKPYRQKSAKPCNTKRAGGNILREGLQHPNILNQCQKTS